jgi:uncharacterized lipoprotein YddW (UPF0748 family)
MRQKTALHTSARLAALLLVLATCVGAWLGRATPVHAAPDEIRALWVLRTSLASRATIGAMVESARQNGFNTLLVQVRGRGDAYFNNGIEPRAAAIASQPADFDPLEETLTRAHAAGLRVHAWMSVNLVSSAAELPIAREHLVYRHPEWLMVPRALASQLQAVSSESPAYIGRLARWSRTQSETVEGLYLSPVPNGAADHTVSVVTDLVKRYAVDGVHLDYVRFPSSEFDYSRSSVGQFRAEMLPDLPASTRQELDARLDVDPFVYPDAFPERWRAFRQSRLTALVMRIRTAVKRTRAATIVSAAVVPDVAAAAREHMQDWRSWVDEGLIDVVCPMAYTQDPAVFREQIESARQVAGLHAVWAGIGAYRLTTAQTIENIRAARRLGVKGVILFSYDSLISPTAGADYLTEVARAAFTASSQ